MEKCLLSSARQWNMGQPGHYGAKSYSAIALGPVAFEQWMTNTLPEIFVSSKSPSNFDFGLALGGPVLFSSDSHWIFSDLEYLSNMKWQHSVSDPDSRAPRSNHVAGTCSDVRNGLKMQFGAIPTTIGCQECHRASITGFYLPNRAGIQ